jgi:hypothetical protein
LRNNPSQALDLLNDFWRDNWTRAVGGTATSQAAAMKSTAFLRYDCGVFWSKRMPALTVS